MDASRKNPGSIHDEKRLIQFSRLCRKSGHISAGGENPLSAGDNSHSGAGTVIVGVNSLCITGVAIDIEDSLAFVGVDDVDEDIIKEYEERFLAYINDDMNMPGAMSVVWEIARNAKKSIKFADLLLKFDKVLGLDMKNAENYLLEFKHEESEELPEEIKALVEERKQARAEKNWAKSDEIRDRIISLGYSIKDTKDGIIVKKEN